MNPLQKTLPSSYKNTRLLKNYKQHKLRKIHIETHRLQQLHSSATWGSSWITFRCMCFDVCCGRSLSCVYSYLINVFILTYRTKHTHTHKRLSQWHRWPCRSVTPKSITLQTYLLHYLHSYAKVLQVGNKSVISIHNTKYVQSHGGWYGVVTISSIIAIKTQPLNDFWKWFVITF